MEKNRIKKEKSILGSINDLSHKLVLVLVIPIVLSLVLMLVYAGKYHSAIERMETIASIKTIVASDIPGSAWNIIIGRDDFASSKLYLKIHDVENTIEKITESTDSENRLSLIVAGRTMKTLESYVDRIRDNITDQVPVVENEAVLVEVRDVASLVDSMLNEYIAQEIDSTGKMSGSLQLVISLTAIAEIVIVVISLWVRNRSVKKTALFVRQPIEHLEEVTAKLSEGTLDARLADTDVTELRNLTAQVNTMAKRLKSMMEKSGNTSFDLILTENFCAFRSAKHSVIFGASCICIVVPCDISEHDVVGRGDSTF